MRLKYLADVRVSNVDKKSYDGEKPVRLCNYTDVYYGDEIGASQGDFMAATASETQIANFRLEAGDTVLTKDSETPEDIGVSAYISQGAPDFVCGYHLAVLRPNPSVTEPKFLSWAVRGHAVRQQLSIGATGVTRFGLRTEALANVTLDLPDLQQQRRIADFLDEQVALLDRATELRGQQAALLNERRWTALVERVQDVEPVPLRRVVAFMTDGPFGSAFTSADYVPAGAVAVRLGNIGFAEYRPDNEIFIPEGLWEKFPRCHVRRGDLLVASLGDPKNHAGRACVAPDLGPALVKGKCFCVRVDDRLAFPDYIALMLSSPLGADLLSVETRGSTRGMINLEILRSIALPMPTREQQQQIAVETRRDWSRSAQLAELVGGHLGLLEERKQALITAAVTGQFDVTTARSLGTKHARRGAWVAG